jgi:hypothetical protein
VYQLIFKSRKPEAKAFKRWICHEVLPAIRKTGAYGLSNKHIPGYGYLGKKFMWLQSDLKKEMPGYNGRVKPGSNLPGIAMAMERLVSDVFLAVSVLAIKYDALNRNIGECLAKENPSLDDIRFWHSHITSHKAHKQLGG